MCGLRAYRAPRSASPRGRLPASRSARGRDASVRRRRGRCARRPSSGGRPYRVRPDGRRPSRSAPLWPVLPSQQPWLLPLLQRCWSRTCRAFIQNSVVFFLGDPSLEPPRLVDDSLEQPRDRIGAERPFRGDASHVVEHLLLAIRLVDLDAHLLLEAADFTRAPGPLVQQTHEYFVHAVDVLSQIL